MKNYGKLVHQDSGAFKDVNIYEHAVTKRAQGYGSGYTQTISYEDAKEHSCFYDSENNFDHNLVDEYNDNLSNDRQSTEDGREEMENEYNFMKKFSHLPVLTPIIEGDETEYAMKKAKVFDEFEEIDENSTLYIKKSKEIKIKLIKKLHDINIKVSLSSFEHSRMENFIKIGLMAKLKTDRIANDLFILSRLDSKYGLFRDMHQSNVGVYKNHIVTFDAGQTNERDGSMRERFKDRQKNSLTSSRKQLDDRLVIQNKPYYNMINNAIKRKKAIVSYRNGREIRFVPKEIKVGWSNNVYCYDLLSNYIPLDELTNIKEA